MLSSLQRTALCQETESLVLKLVAAPHTAIREDASMNLEAVDELVDKFPDIELVFIEAAVTTCLQHLAQS